jgi:ABC-type lipoprotein release transport system permease subunit
LASVLLLTQSLRREAEHLLADAPDLTVQAVMAGRHDLIPLQYAEAIREIPGVGAVRPRYWGYYYDALTGGNYTVMAIDPEAPLELELVDGVLPSGPGQCAIGAGVAAARQVDVGGELVLVDSANVGLAYDIVGTFSVQSQLLTNDLVVMTRDEVIAFFGFPEGRATDLSVGVFNPLEVATVAAKIKRLFPGSRPISRSEIVRTYDAVFHWRSGMMLSVFFSALVAFCVLAWDKATGISAEERREIGILKAVGWATSDVLELKFWEGAAISCTAFLLGVNLALVHVFVFSAPLLVPVIKGWSVLFPDFELTPAIDLYQLFVMGFLTVAPYIASTVIPSWRTATIDPEEVMRW